MRIYLVTSRCVGSNMYRRIFMPGSAPRHAAIVTVIYNHRLRPAVLSHGVGAFSTGADAAGMQRSALRNVCYEGRMIFTSFRAVQCQSRTH